MKRIAITGASGHLGRKLFEHLKANKEYSVIGLDIRPSIKDGIFYADFTVSDEEWIDHLNEIDVLVHLAADREPDASWESAIKNNINGTMNLFEAAKCQGVKKIVFASSNWLHGGYRFSDDYLSPDLCPYPVNAYGVAKLFGERLGEHFSQYHDMSVVCMRIGWTQWTHGNQPGDHMAMGLWGQEMWLSDEDYLSGMQCAIDAKDVKFEILNLMSNNQGMRWDINRTKDIIGYIPVSSSVPKASLNTKIKSYLYHLLVRKIPSYFERKMSGW